MGLPAAAVVLALGAGVGRCCWMAARGGGAKRGSALGMHRLKSHRCQTAGQKSGRWPSERAARARERDARVLGSCTTGTEDPCPLPKAPRQQNPPRDPPVADPVCNPAGPTRAKSREVRAGISDIEGYFLETRVRLQRYPLQGAADETACGVKQPVPQMSHKWVSVYGRLTVDNLLERRSFAPRRAVVPQLYWDALGSAPCLSYTGMCWEAPCAWDTLHAAGAIRERRKNHIRVGAV